MTMAMTMTTTSRPMAAFAEAGRRVRKKRGQAKEVDDIVNGVSHHTRRPSSISELGPRRRRNRGHGEHWHFVCIELTSHGDSLGVNEHVAPL
mmetsp:Transcript_22040/g.32967  ORF Transcript_22040/g.32967 Transcript_22040/m.32967 type:complete len:92 (+) Transcript_22040:434-709(+)